MKLDQTTVTILVVIGVLLIICLCMYYSRKEMYILPNYGEWSEECNAGAVHCTLSNGMEGNCISNSICSPAYSKNHIAAALNGYHPQRISAAFENLLRHSNM